MREYLLTNVTLPVVRTKQGQVYFAHRHKTNAKCGETILGTLPVVETKQKCLKEYVLPVVGTKQASMKRKVNFNTSPVVGTKRKCG